jgi:two-component system chemotaxis response regulator CheY
MVRCLVIDDSAVIRTIARRILEDLGCDVEEAEDGRQALSSCKIRIPDVILLDWHLPGINPHNLLTAVRRLRRSGVPHVIYCMTENDSADRERALAGGADDWLMKPYDRESLRAKIEVLALAT